VLGIQLRQHLDGYFVMRAGSQQRPDAWQLFIEADVDDATANGHDHPSAERLRRFINIPFAVFGFCLVDIMIIGGVVHAGIHPAVSLNDL
jgi:hypothetical protein